MALYIGNKKYCAVQKTGINNQDILITANCNYTAEDQYSGFGLVRVQVPEAILDELTVHPSTEQQILEPLNDGFSKVTVNPVTAAIDSDIIASNIKKDVEILGVTGTLEFTTEELSITPTIAQQVFEPTEDGYSKVTVSGVTASIDSNIQAGNILQNVEILGVTGTVIQANETTRNITENGTFTPPQPYTGFSEVVVDVPAILEPLTVTPTTEQQTFTSEDVYHGFSPVVVNGVTSGVDANIKPENIKDGITILGVEGTCVELNGTTQTVTPTTSQQVLTPASPYNGFIQVSVNAVTSAIDANIKPENIKLGVEILGVTGTLNFTTEELTVNPTTSQQVFEPTENGYSKVTVNAVTAAIDPDITAANILSGVNILGVVGTAIESNTQDIDITSNGTYHPEEGYTGFDEVRVNINTVNNTTLTITPSTTSQSHTPQSPYTGYGTVTVNPVTASIDPNITAANIKEGVTILGVTGTLRGNPNLQTKYIDDVGTFYPDEGYDGFSSVEVNMDWIVEALQALNAGDISTEVQLQSKTVSQAGTYTPDAGYDAFSSVTVDLSWVQAEIDSAATRYTTTEADAFMNASTTQINSGVTAVRDYACYYMLNLQDVTLTNATAIGQFAFANSGIQTLTIMTNQVCTLNSINALESTNNLTAIYVPDNLVSSYKSATNWATYSNLIVGISTRA